MNRWEHYGAYGTLVRREEPDDTAREWSAYDGAGRLMEKRPYTGEQNAALDNEAARVAAEEAALRAFAQPTIDGIDRVLQARGLAALNADERTSLADRLVYLGSRGTLGKVGG